MYEKHFGLKSRPFRSRTDASGVFVGPAQVKLISSLKKAFAAGDAIVTVTGPVGVGKSTVVNRALENIGSQRIVAQVGRMQLAADEVLELLLTEFNVSRQPNGTIQRFAAFKRLLHDWAAAGTRAFIIVEDADRIGSDALIELEALTASDSGDGAGAGIVLMGQPTLSERIAHPELARLRQRIRLRHVAAPFSAAETQGYLKHCIRNAGGEFDKVFDPAAVDMVYRCSEGVPRVINNLCESVLAAAAEASAPLVMPQLVQHIAQEEFGLQPGSKKAGLASSSPDSRQAKAKESPAEATPDTPDPATDTPKLKAEVRPAKPEPEPAVMTDTAPRTPAPKREPKTDKAIDTAPAKDVSLDAGARPGKDADEFEPLPVSAFTTEPESRPVQNLPPAAPVVAEEKPAEVPAATPALPKPSAQRQPAAEPAVADIAVTGADSAPVNKPAWAPDASAAKDDASLDEIPELIQDTQPRLAALDAEDDLPDLTDLVVPGPAGRPKGTQAPRGAGPTAAVAAKAGASGDIPTLSGELRIDKKRESTPPPPAARKPGVPISTVPETIAAPPAVAGTENKDPKTEQTITEIPSWDRDPTLAELKPDLAALEAELAVAVPETPPAAEATRKPAPPPAKKVDKAAPAFDLPEITLEKELQVREIEAQEMLRKPARPDAGDPDADAPIKRKHGFDLDKIAAELGKARSLEDVDDKLAETLFGEEMANAAAEIAAMVAANEPESPLADAALELLNDSAPRRDAPVAGKKPAPAKPVAPGTGAAANAPAGKPAPAPTATKTDTDAAVTPAVEITLQSLPDPELPAASETPEPIEEQFGTSMTATLKALSAAQVQAMDQSANDEEEKPARKLFGLFRGGT